MGSMLSRALLKPLKYNFSTFFNHPTSLINTPTLIITAVAVYVGFKNLKPLQTYLKPKRSDIVVITGCDSGIGFSAAFHCYKLGFHVVAGVLDVNSEGAALLRGLGCRNEISVKEINVTDSSKIKKCVEHVQRLVGENETRRLHAIINNAGVMVFGELEWQTEEMIKSQLNVNLLGPILVTKAFLPLLRKFKGRVINVSSHCALEPLPGVSAYSASKSGLQALNNSTRVEYAKYGVKVISFVPGSFFSQTKILSNQPVRAAEMYENMNEECKEFYGQYFHTYNSYLEAVSNGQKDEPIKQVEDNYFYENYTHALLAESPREMYKNGPWYYEIHHLLFKMLPTSLRDRLVVRFVRMPKFEADSSADKKQLLKKH